MDPLISLRAREGAARARRRLRRPRDLSGKGVNLVLLTAVWVLLVGRLSVFTVVSGALIATIVTLLFPMPAIVWPGWIHPIGALRLVGAVTWDLARASVQLAWFALSWRRQPRSGVVAVPLSSDADLYQVATGTILSIVPGSVVVEARWRTRTLYMHIFDMAPGDAARERTGALRAELRILRAFGTTDEIAQACEHLRALERGTAPGSAAAGEERR
ncbi:Na+/H+ antiporter subunit E [Actinomyces urogenitalis]|uniref:Na+/H+ antiporter subunit E n=1 Tax=Actinomyces urogenitalis TaxID=103621 RepID=UPI00242D8A84|nr:Na+/H+ antiporter subunit E [Actinomyces urogenitalis]MCI7455900.1 Na+/H+ antiporter subunit E [Actinomyces urogenitalis]